jgi:aspartyl-tRNA(Asn)/glutamyl-tRNA(Gln) amidotransferase subunit C
MNPSESESVLTDATVRHVATLARLAIPDEDIKTVKDDLTAIFEHIDTLRTVDTDGVEPLDHPTELLNHVRDDNARSALSQEQVLANAPSVEGVYFDVPKVLGDGE